MSFLKSRIFTAPVSIVLIAALVFCLVPMPVLASGLGLGCEGGITLGGTDEKTVLEYKEVCFITGEPVEMAGTVSIRKSTRQDMVNITYTYNLKNAGKDMTLVRNVSYDIKTVEAAGGQVVEEITLSKNPSETVRAGNSVYSLRSYEFSSSRIIDKKPAINYFAGNMRWRKTYQVTGTNNMGSVTMEITGRSFGYDQSWGNTETSILNYEIMSEKTIGDVHDMWAGRAEVTVSSSVVEDIKYVENIPEQISFQGGYVKTRNNTSILEYYCSLPEFDAKGISTYKMIETRNSLKLEAFPKQVRLPVQELPHLRGHWAEDNIKMLFSLGIFSNVFNDNDGNGRESANAGFDPEQLITRAEFVAALVKTVGEQAGDVQEDKATASRRTRSVRIGKQEEEILSPYADVPVDHVFFQQIKAAHEKGLILGKATGVFAPGDEITLAEVIVLFVRALGLEKLAPNPYAITFFMDDTSIPGYARNAIFAAERIGLIKGDNNGYLGAGEKITRARAADLLITFIEYMREGIRKDYRERIFGYY
ncbi:MAG: S-layer homology domain-containing protein [Clostridiaceae bacterium]|nr:S-layer homology domain-containing protein [Clostridiaceae bacterium]